MKSKTNLFYGFLGIWLLVNLIQSFFLDITHDEAYYFVFSENMAWGYLDHPPVIAAMIKLGYTLLPNELGARLIGVLMTTASIFFIRELVQPKNEKLFILMVCSVIPLHLAGFHAIPDIPLLFFSATFLYLLKKYLDEDSWLLATLLGLNIALLLLSKYFGILLIVFTLVAVPSLFKRKTFWYITGLSLLCFLPHWIWQHQHDYISLKFHLNERNDQFSHSMLDVGSNLFFLLGPIRFAFIFLLFVGPFIGPILLWAAYKNKATTPFEKILSYMLWGMIAILMIQAFRGEVRVHWATVAIIPLVIKSGMYIDRNADRLKKWIIPAFWLTIIPIGLARIVMVYDFIPQDLMRHDYYHGWQQWTNEFEEAAGDRPVVFLNSFPDASRFSFYSDRPTTSMNNVHHYRRNQFDLLDYDKDLLGKDVLVCLKKEHPKMQLLETTIGKKHRYVLIDDFVFYPRIRMQAGGDVFKPNEFNNSISVPIFIIENPYTKEELRLNPSALPRFSYHVFSEYGELYCESVTNQLFEDMRIYPSPGESVPPVLEIHRPEEAGKYLIKIGLKTVDLPPTYYAAFEIELE